MGKDQNKNNDAVPKDKSNVKVSDQAKLTDDVKNKDQNKNNDAVPKDKSNVKVSDQAKLTDDVKNKEQVQNNAVVSVDNSRALVPYVKNPSDTNTNQTKNDDFK